MAEPAFTAIDHALMAQALRLAERAAYTTKPNPMVGCVIAHGERIVGEGWHRRVGGPHAEVFALQAAGEQAKGATAYVTLEPCAHTGRTGPCADALIAAGIARVVAAMRDPFPQVDGAGFERLKAAGIVVQDGLMQAQARHLNRGFLSRIERGRPWLRVKLATSIDGRSAMANGDSKWISGDAARDDVHRWRARSGAILTGSGTVLADDPQLTVRLNPLSLRERGWGEGTEHLGVRTETEPSSGAPRHLASRPGLSDDAQALDVARAEGSQAQRLAPMGEGEQEFVAPLRVVLDPGLATVARGRVREGDAPTLYLHAPDAKPPNVFSAQHASVPMHDGALDLDAVLKLLAAREINEVQVEAGATLAGAFLSAGLVDELLLYVAPVLLGERARPLFDGLRIDDMAQRLRMRIVETRRIGNDVRVLLQPEPGAL